MAKGHKKGLRVKGFESMEKRHKGGKKGHRKAAHKKGRRK